MAFDTSTTTTTDQRSDQTHDQKIQSLQHSILFLQSQHASTLFSLHKEIEKLQNKCSGIYINYIYFVILYIYRYIVYFACVFCRRSIDLFPRFTFVIR